MHLYAVLYIFIYPNILHHAKSITSNRRIYNYTIFFLPIIYTKST